ncbi:MAG: amino acid deaminase [Castellaniella sp.]|uniref:alanine racemase n=1 Tax=Castellaniella sp. TaxID=1955812 RepID=UPI00122B03AA|nr:alanine racemase [Castellaniella sp.]TAN25820.1 MAG: amino acid deaminase [Castellaniella sp.]
MQTPLTPQIRGIPIGISTDRDSIASLQLRPSSGNMPLPVLTLDEAQFQANTRLMLQFCSQNGLKIAPHAKTPMSPDLAKRLIQAGAWGASVANLQQAAVLLAHGVDHLILANEIGGRRSGERLGQLLAQYPDAECLVFADSPQALDALAAAGQTRKKPISVLLELGAGRCGARDLPALKALASHALDLGGLIAVRGIAAYEGSAEADSEEAKLEKIRALLQLCTQAATHVRSTFHLHKVVFSVGGSHYFDLVCEAVRQAGIPGLVPILRSGAIFFLDHGVYQRSLQEMDARCRDAHGHPTSPAAQFAPAMRLWAEVLSHPEPDLYICGIGKRDVSHDLDLPVPLAVYRDGLRIAERTAIAAVKVTELNDQHAFLTAQAASAPVLQPGDIIEFGISHPCTCFDKWNLIYGLQGDTIAAAYRTCFG